MSQDTTTLPEGTPITTESSSVTIPTPQPTTVQSDNLQNPTHDHENCKPVARDVNGKELCPLGYEIIQSETPQVTQEEPETEVPAESTKPAEEASTTAIPQGKVTNCPCMCHMAVPPLDKESHPESCWHCKPKAHPQPKQEEHPNLNAGNNNEDIKWAEKWATPEQRIVACEQYCEYLRQGRSKKYYPEAAPATINKYIENYPEEFRPEKIADAERRGLANLEATIIQASRGKIEKANATLLIWISKNKLGWRDKMQFVDDEDYDMEWGNGEEKA